jgi:hypothetical protein
MPGVERRRPGDEDRVDRRQDDEGDRDHDRHLVGLVGSDAVGRAKRDELRALWRVEAVQQLGLVLLGDTFEVGQQIAFSGR